MARRLEGCRSTWGTLPLEGRWRDAGSAKLIVTAKYEAWPEIWNSLTELEVPSPSSGEAPQFDFLGRSEFFAASSGVRPRILFLVSIRERAGLAGRFPDAASFHGSDPRWDRYFSADRTRIRG